MFIKAAFANVVLLYANTVVEFRKWLFFSSCQICAVNMFYAKTINISKKLIETSTAVTK